MPDQRFHVDGARVLADLNTLRGIGAYKTGVHKPTFSEPHMRSLEWLVQRLPEAGLAGGIDGIGNVLGTSAKSGPKLLAGSHLESQNYAGWLDGPLGVVYALEAARVINPDPNVKGAVEVAVVVRRGRPFRQFPRQPVVCRRRYRGRHRRRARSQQRSNHARRLREVGLAGRPRAKAERGRHIGYLEAHIEQGQTLESGALGIGVVTSIVGIWQYRITFTGEQNHAGTTRMADRRDAGLALAKFCVDIDERFPTVCGPRTVWTTGSITLEPGAPSIIPGKAEMLFQMRDDDPAVIDRLEHLLRNMATKVGARGPCAVAVERIRTGAPAMMDAAIPGCDRSREQGLCRRQIDPNAECRRSRRPGARHHHAVGHAVRALDRRHQPSLDREHGGRRHRHRRRGLCRRLPAAVGGMSAWPLIAPAGRNSRSPCL